MSNLVAAFQGMVIGAALIIFATHVRTYDGVWIPCDLVEISPDIPPAAKEECRRRRRNK